MNINNRAMYMLYFNMPRYIQYKNHSCEWTKKPSSYTFLMSHIKYKLPGEFYGFVDLIKVYKLEST